MWHAKPHNEPHVRASLRDACAVYFGAADPAQEHGHAELLFQWTPHVREWQVCELCGQCPSCSAGHPAARRALQGWMSDAKAPARRAAFLAHAERVRAPGEKALQHCLRFADRAGRVLLRQGPWSGSYPWRFAKWLRLPCWGGEFDYARCCIVGDDACWELGFTEDCCAMWPGSQNPVQAGTERVGFPRLGLEVESVVDAESFAVAQVLSHLQFWSSVLASCERPYEMHQQPEPMDPMRCLLACDADPHCAGVRLEACVRYAGPCGGEGPQWRKHAVGRGLRLLAFGDAPGLVAVLAAQRGMDAAVGGPGASLAAELGRQQGVELLVAGEDWRAMDFDAFAVVVVTSAEDCEFWSGLRDRVVFVSCVLDGSPCFALCTAAPSSVQMLPAVEESPYIVFIFTPEVGTLRVSW